MQPSQAEYMKYYQTLPRRKKKRGGGVEGVGEDLDYRSPERYGTYGLYHQHYQGMGGASTARSPHRSPHRRADQSPLRRAAEHAQSPIRRADQSPVRHRPDQSPHHRSPQRYQPLMQYPHYAQDQVCIFHLYIYRYIHMLTISLKGKYK